MGALAFKIELGETWTLLKQDYFPSLLCLLFLVRDAALSTATATGVPAPLAKTSAHVKDGDW